MSGRLRRSAKCTQIRNLRIECEPGSRSASLRRRLLLLRLFRHDLAPRCSIG